MNIKKKSFRFIWKKIHVSDWTNEWINDQVCVEEITYIQCSKFLFFFHIMIFFFYAFILFIQLLQLKYHKKMKKKIYDCHSNFIIFIYFNLQYFFIFFYIYIYCITLHFHLFKDIIFANGCSKIYFHFL